jgi:hypothetical protein
MTSSKGPQALPYDTRIAELSERLEAARGEVAAIESELDWWRKGRDLYGSPNGTLDTGAKPTLARGIIRLMSEDDREEWPTSAIIEALKDRGWMPNGTSAVHAVRTKLAKLARGDDPALERVRHGTYALAKRDSLEQP